MEEENNSRHTNKRVNVYIPVRTTTFWLYQKKSELGITRRWVPKQGGNNFGILYKLSPITSKWVEQCKYVRTSYALNIVTFFKKVPFSY